MPLGYKICFSFSKSTLLKVMKGKLQVHFVIEFNFFKVIFDPSITTCALHTSWGLREEIFHKLYSITSI